MLLNALQNYFSDYCEDWDLFCELLPNGCNWQVYSITNAIPFEITLCRTPLTLVVDKKPIFVDEEAKTGPSVT